MQIEMIAFVTSKVSKEFQIPNSYIILLRITREISYFLEK